MNTGTLKKFVEISKAMMPQAHSSRTFHTTFILNKSKLLAVGVNNGKTHPAILKYDYWDCSGLTFVNVRLKKDGMVGNSLPCRGCMSMLNQIGFKKIYFTDEKGDFQKLK